MSSNHCSKKCSFTQARPKRKQTDLEWFVEVMTKRQERLALPDVSMNDIRWFMNLMSQRKAMI